MADLPLKIAILASGSGTNAQAIIESIERGSLNAEISVIIANNPNAGVLTRAQAAGVPSLLLDHRKYVDRVAHDRAIMEALSAHPCQYLIMAGYMRLLSHVFLESWQDRILNIHPALLPSFPGTRGIRDAIEYGVRLTGPTVHFVVEKMDAGPIIIQGAMPVENDAPEAEIAASIHEMEHRIYPQAIQWLAEGRLRLEQGRVVLTPDKKRKKVVWPNRLVSPPLEEGF